MIDLQELLLQNDYDQIANYCKEVIERYPNVHDNYCYLGLALLLQEKEEEAKTIWSLGLKNSGCEELYTKKLCKILTQESAHQEELKKYQVALEIRQHIRQVSPKDFSNLVQILYLYLELQIFTIEILQELDLINLIQSGTDINDNSLIQLIENISYAPISQEESISFYLEFISSCLPYVQSKETCASKLIYVAMSRKFRLDISLKFIDMSLQLCPDSLMVLGFLVQIYIKHEQYNEAIALSRDIIVKFPDNLDQTIAYHLLLSSLMSAGGNWQEVKVVFDKHESLLSQLAEQNPIDVPRFYITYICMACFFAPYIQDIPQSNRAIQNKIMGLVQANLQQSHLELTQQFKNHQQARREIPKNLKTSKLRIGYLATSLRQHSVGWLARSLFQYFDRDAFEIYGYFPEYGQARDFLQEWYIGQMHKSYRQGVDYWGDNFLVAEQIDRDEIDILVDLESMTSGNCCDILALKPAPLQVTWLGWDASGLPAIDYYIADPYVLPDNAQEYYSEKIWRLPKNYIAVDGFETAISSLSRADLDIPADAIVYFSSQKSYKRHVDIVRAQLQIIRQVPNSYFLIKGLADENAMQNFFYEIAESEGVERDHLKFLPFADSEAEHRANMAIADVVLDTYPYNGATTTMETLWMGIPMVTQVGEQFVSRNSYTMMVNAGITEGIAWNVEEYVKWGVKFGTDAELRREVAWKLRQSRKTSPLWDGRQFAKEMEKAYKQMWETHNG
jgi:predicted O-linked N-acetylglucosamine transferase (SPINDLY family)